MPAWVIWAVAAAILGAGEVATLTFFLGPVALAAAIAAVVAAAGAGTELQVAVFIIAAFASLVLIRPIATRHLRTPAQLRTGTAALVGSHAIVLERVDANGGTVKLAGDIWTARAYDEEQVIKAGARVEVLKIEGATALVSE